MAFDLDDEELRATREKSADEMFEKLDYKKHDNHPEEDEPTKPNMFVTQDMRQLYYEQRGNLNDDRYAVEHIHFDLKSKNVVCYATIDGKYTVVPLCMDELKAIYKKCQERGWLE